MSKVRLIDANALKEAIKDNGYSHYFEIFDIIDNAPTVHHPNCDICEDKAKQYSLGFQDGYLTGKERPQGECENCDFRKFTEKFIDGVVEVMNENGITSIEQLSEILKGGAE